MNNAECNAVHTTLAGNTYRCNMHRGHSGDHKRMNVRYTHVLFRWPRTAVELHPSMYAKGGVVSGRGYGKTTAAAEWEVEHAQKEAAKLKDDMKQGQHPVLFSTHELAELYVILSGNHDIPEVYLNKLGAALKKSL